MMKKKLLSIVLLVLAALVLAIAPAAQAEPVDYVDFVGDASALLNFTDRAVLAAVNFYDPDREATGSLPVGVIQGVDFYDFMVDVDDTGLPIALSDGAPGAPGATLSTVIAESSGRDFEGAAGSGAPSETQLGSFSPVSDDNTEAEKLANCGAYFQSHVGCTLTFAFGADWANTAVQVQMLGGGHWNKEPEIPYMGVLTASVDGVDLGYVEDQGYNMQLSTFEATTDGNGDLVIVVTLTGDRYAVLAGIAVTAEPIPPFLPEDGDQAVNPIGTELSWILPPPADPNTKVTVWFEAVGDLDTPIVDGEKGKTSLLVGDLDENTDYTWRVKFIDPNDDNVVISDTTLTFKTLLSNQAPTVEVDDFYTWLEEDGRQTITIDTAVITDTDGTSLHTYTWSVDDGPAGVDFSPNGTNEAVVTDATFTAAGVYVLQLEVNDNNGDYEIPGTVNVTVYEDGCAAAIAENGYDEDAALSARDANYDCQVNLADFAALAAAWMNSNVQ